MKFGKNFCTSPWSLPCFEHINILVFVKFRQKIFKFEQKKFNICWKMNFLKISCLNMLDDVCWNCEGWAVQKYVNLVDASRSRQEISNEYYLQKSAPIQRITSLSSFGGDSVRLFIHLFSLQSTMPHIAFLPQSDLLGVNFTAICGVKRSLRRFLGSVPVGSITNRYTQLRKRSVQSLK